MLSARADSGAVVARYNLTPETRALPDGNAWLCTGMGVNDFPMGYLTRFELRGPGRADFQRADHLGGRLQSLKYGLGLASGASRSAPKASSGRSITARSAAIPNSVG